MGFTEWIIEKYNEWSQDRSTGGRHKDSHAAYARWIGVNQQLISSWLLGKAVPDLRSKNNIHKLAARYGTEIYDVLGIDYTVVDLLVATAYILPEEKRPELLKALYEWGDRNGYNLRIPRKSEE